MRSMRSMRSRKVNAGVKLERRMAIRAGEGEGSAIFLGGLAGGFVRWFGEWGGRGVTARVGLSPPDDGDSALMGLASGLADWLLARWNCANVRVPGKERLQEAGLSSLRWLRDKRPLLGRTPPRGSRGGPTTHHRGHRTGLHFELDIPGLTRTVCIVHAAW